jgi:iron complex transport system permease protein
MLRRPLPILLILLLLLITSIFVTTCIGVSGLSLWNSDTTMIQKLLFEVRLPRVCGAMLIGIGLAAAGCAMQGLFRNPMADPYIIGTSSGGALGAAFSILFFDGSFLPVLAFAGATLSTIMVYAISLRNGHVTVETLLLSGIAISLFLSAILSFFMCISGNSLHQIMFWMMGGLWNVYWDDVGLCLLIPVACIIMFVFSRDLNVMALGEEEAVHLGVNTKKTKWILLLISSFITSVAVSIAGCIGFIGLVIPHIMRILTGPDHRILLPVSMMTGAILLMWADTAARTLPVEIPVGIITALLGTPFFVYLLRRRTQV